MKTRRGLGPRHTAPQQRQTGVLAGDQTARQPIQVSRNGAYELAMDKSLVVDERGRLSVAPQAIVTASGLAGDNLEVRGGALRVGLGITKAQVTASGAYVQTEAQAVADKLDELIGLLQSDAAKGT